MSFYNKSTNFAVKDSLTTGDPNKIVSGVEIDTEFTNIASAFSSLNFSANSIDYSNTASGLTATDVQAAIDEAIVPSGAIQHFATQVAPSGWLKANGADVSRTTYSKLFAAIGTTFGAGNGSTTFTLPDLRGEFIRGWDNGRGVDSGRGFGSSQSNQNQSHSHGGSIGSVGNHTHSVGPFVQDSGGGDDFSGGSNGVMRTLNSGGGGGHGHSLSISSSGGNESRPRNIALLVCIKT